LAGRVEVEADASLYSRDENTERTHQQYAEKTGCFHIGFFLGQNEATIRRESLIHRNELHILITHVWAQQEQTGQGCSCRESASLKTKRVCQSKE
jgi:hypothetical protein